MVGRDHGASIFNPILVLDLLSTLAEKGAHLQVMREWIRFGAVVLVVDYFLELTFFSTVLSIDIQRLEVCDPRVDRRGRAPFRRGLALVQLADLLAQNSATPYKPELESSSVSAYPHDISRGYTPGSVARSTWKVLRDRPAKTSTVAFLWIINTFLWTS